MASDIFSTLSYINCSLTRYIWHQSYSVAHGAQINSSIDFKSKNLQIILNDIAPNILHKTLLNVN